MRNTFRYRLYPTHKQETLLNQELEECRWLYNHFLEHRRDAWEWYGAGLSLYDKIGTLPNLKKIRPSLNTVYSQTLQNVAVRIDLAFQAFFRRVKNGENPGYPRFRGKGQYSQVTYPQWNSGCDLTGKGLRLSKVGVVPIVLHTAPLRSLWEETSRRQEVFSPMKRACSCSTGTGVPERETAFLAKIR